ncbi:integrase arm-type DNA-binding domain-containing protein [Bradyrhizobium sp. CSA207]|uniref:tyrosine-type recombinase/integrase n=1 Tax=Bradyrhizobium sp. CSA207 TaxID=2698826 RepID=UPI0023AEF702|nr:integrase family protein [Bradyrhizobium sp. CSA207]MDE5446459.1 integrase arm-type DNA-binding domain-containing protein [Bradyrhizobium sp. CSA207]
MKAKLTDTGIRSYQPRAAQYSIGDAACPGLCIRITPGGVKTFAFAYRNKGTGKVTWLTLGRYPDVPLSRAREIANDARKTVAGGGTPLTPKIERAEAEKKTKTYADVVVLYHDAKLVALRSGKKTRQTLERVGRVYGWDDRPLSSITDDDAAKMLHHIAVKRGKKAAANQTKHILHTMFKWAKQPGQKFVTVNPFADLAAPGGAKVARRRFLSAAEIRQLWNALDEPERFKVSPDAATALRLILVTAARPGMVAGMVGGELRDLTGPSEHGPHWSLSAERMKAGSPFITPLTGLALELLRPYLQRDPEARLFKLGGRQQLHEAAKRIVEGLKMERWTPHDLRRTSATVLDRAGYSLEEIGALLAHTRKGVTAVYARWDKFDLRREMAMVIERSLRETLTERPEAAQLAA